MSRTIIENATVYTGEEVLSPASVVIEGQTVLAVSPAAEGRGLQPDEGGNMTPHDAPHRTGSTEAGDPDREAGHDLRSGAADWRIDAAGQLVTPGLVNAHTHIYSALARGIALKDPAPSDFPETLERLWWRLDRALTLDDIELSALLHGIEGLKSGVTTIFDHHASQRVVAGSLRTISRALAGLGIRSCLCFEVSDREGVGTATAGIEENRSFLREVSSAGGSMSRAKFGLHASFTLSNETLKSCAAACDSDTTGFHVHVAEGPVDQEITRRRYGTGVIDRLKAHGILGRGTIAVHGVHLDDREVEILAGSGSWLAHCPQSNMNNAVGAPRLDRFARLGARTVLGTDGFTANLCREALVGHLLQSHIARDPRAGYISIPALLFGANGMLASETFGLPIGCLRAGGQADLVIWDYRPPCPLTAENIWGHVLFGLVDAGARDVWVAGRRVLEEGEPITCAADEVMARCRAAAARLWERF